MCKHRLVNVTVHMKCEPIEPGDLNKPENNPNEGVKVFTVKNMDLA